MFVQKLSSLNLSSSLYQVLTSPMKTKCQKSYIQEREKGMNIYKEETMIASNLYVMLYC
jgi:hypothetical protein